MLSSSPVDHGLVISWNEVSTPSGGSAVDRYHLAVGGYSGDGGPATDASLSGYPNGVTTDTAGNVYIGDNNNSRVRVVTQFIPPTAVSNVRATMQAAIAPNPARDHINVTVPGSGRSVLTLSNVKGEVAARFDFAAGGTVSLPLTLAPGMYFYRLVGGSDIATGQLDVLDQR